MANNQNLRPLNTLPVEQRREIARKGGKASGAARRAKRDRVNQEKAVIMAQQEQQKDDIVTIRKMARELRKYQLLLMREQLIKRRGWPE